MEQNREVGEKVAEIILQLHRYASGNTRFMPFHIILDDPAGNSFIQNPQAPLKDPNLHVSLLNDVISRLANVLIAVDKLLSPNS